MSEQKRSEEGSVSSPVIRKRYIATFALALTVIVGVVVFYLSSLQASLTSNLMTSVDEISLHDVESIEAWLDTTWSRLDSVSNRLEATKVDSVFEAEQELNIEAASSEMFDALYLLASDGTLYSSTYVELTDVEHSYDELMATGQDRFAMLYEEENGRLETTKESLIYGVRIDSLFIEGQEFIAVLGRSDVSTIRNQLLIESFDGQGISSVVNSRGYYIVNSSPATDLAGRDNFYDMLEAGHLEGGVTIDDIRNNIIEGERFTVDCVTADHQALVLSFAPVKGTNWSFLMAVPIKVFEERFAPFMTMTVGMMIVVVLVLALMMALLYRFMRRSVVARAESDARAEFLSNMSHEIRTPLNGIIGIQHLMTRHLDEPSVMQDYVRKLGNAAQYLLSLVNDVLDVSKLQAGKMNVVSEPFNLHEVIENVCEMQREPMADKGIKFTLDETDLRWVCLTGDGVRLSQVIMNILSNAVKFTPRDGSIDVAVRQKLLVSSEVATTITIRDTGCGMTPEFQKHIFDAFTQERNRNSESQKGTGLGMSISFMLMGLMGGTLSVKSTLGKGSCFTIYLPAYPGKLSGSVSGLTEAPKAKEGSTQALVEASAHALAQGVLEGSEESGKEAAATTVHSDALPGSGADSKSEEVPKVYRVLVAEDNELNAEIISTLLTEEGFEVVVAGDGKEALTRFEESTPGFYTVILMDAQMPVMDGYESAQAIRALNHPDAQSVPIIACTASTFAEDRARAEAAGMTDFVAKPIDISALLVKLDALIKGGQ